MGTVSTEGRPPDRPGRADSFCGLMVNSYGLKTKKIHAVRLALSDWLGDYRVFLGVDILA